MDCLWNRQEITADKVQRLTSVGIMLLAKLVAADNSSSKSWLDNSFEGIVISLVRIGATAICRSIRLIEL